MGACLVSRRGNKTLNARKRWVLGLISMMLLVAACGDDSDDASGVGDGGGQTSTANRVVTVAAEDTTFSPDAISVPVGIPVRLELENRDAFEHDLEVVALDADVIDGGVETGEHGSGDDHDGDGGLVAVHAQGQETKHVTFTATDPGEYEFYCTIPGHREAGMVGTLTVE
jgi:uncharacterized cupredoxin-like copper-binding protein